jgi:hypothetical protein
MIGKRHSYYFKTLVLLCILLCGVAARAGEIDLNRPPDYKNLAGGISPEGLTALRNQLGDALASSWKAARSGQRGSCAEELFARWVDLYRWIDLLESDESQLMRNWLARHLFVTEQQSGSHTDVHITIFPPGGFLNITPVSSDLMDKVVADPSMMAQIMDKLVSKPFTPAQGKLAGRLGPDFIAATLSDPDFLTHWSESFSRDDVAPKVLMNLQAIWKASPNDWHELQCLALALAVVKDQPAPEYWPHHQVSPSDVPREELPPEELFAQWAQGCHLGKLRMDPRTLDVEELKFVIDAPLRYTELASIRGNPMLAQQDPGRAFDSITYDQGRMIKNVYDWPWGEYLLTSIKAHGGICVDQAYYAAMAGKAVGIPTIFFSGQGRDGGHAWIGFLKRPGAWDLNVGRYASENYVTGEGLDPQSWTMITDHDLDLITRHLGNRDALNAARRDIVMASDFQRRGEVAMEGAALQSAIQECPENPAFWDAKEEWLGRSGATIEEIKAHHQAAIAQFSRFNDLKAHHQQALVELALKSGKKQDAERISDQIIHENRAAWSHDSRADLGSQAAWVMLAEHLKTRDASGAVEEFERQLRLLGTNGGGEFFYKVVSPLAVSLMKMGKQEQALRVIKESFQTLKPDHDSILDRDFRKLWAAVGGEPSSPVVTPR